MATKQSPVPAVPAVVEKVLCLRTCDAKLKSHGGFQWPASGPVECPDWKPTATCGNELHGLMWGEGDWSLLNSNADAKWMIVSVLATDIVKIDEQKVKFPRGEVVFVGGMAEAMTRILCSPAEFERVKKLADKKSIAEGNYSKAASSGDSSTAASSGNYSKAASSGNYGIAASIGAGGWVMAGDRGLLIACEWDSAARCYRACTGNVGENGIKPYVKYEAKNGKLVEVK